MNVPEGLVMLLLKERLEGREGIEYCNNFASELIIPPPSCSSLFFFFPLLNQGQLADANTAQLINSESRKMETFPITDFYIALHIDSY